MTDCESARLVKKLSGIRQASRDLAFNLFYGVSSYAHTFSERRSTFLNAPGGTASEADSPSDNNNNARRVTPDRCTPLFILAVVRPIPLSALLPPLFNPIHVRTRFYNSSSRRPVNHPFRNRQARVCDVRRCVEGGAAGFCFCARLTNACASHQ